MPEFCQKCGETLGVIAGICAKGRQVVDIPTVVPTYTEHRAYSKACRCGYVTKSAFPSNVKAPIQYGPVVESMASYFSVRQYVPYR